MYRSIEKDLGKVESISTAIGIFTCMSQGNPLQSFLQRKCRSFLGRRYRLICLSIFLFHRIHRLILNYIYACRISILLRIESAFY
jgi:hypothetical protein